MNVLSPKRLLWISAIVPLSAFAFALSTILVPETPDWAAPPVADIAPPPPFYLPLDVPLRAGPQGGNVQIELNLAFSARLAGLDLLALSETVKAKQAAILADLTEVLLQESDKNADPVSLYQTLPPALLTVVNAALSTDTLPNPVSEVLIVNLSVRGN